MLCQRKEELQADKPPGPLYRRGVRIKDQRCFPGHEGGIRAKGCTHSVRMPAEKHPGSHRNGEPFVRVARDRIRVAYSGEMAPEERRDDGGAAPRRVDVKPQILRPEETRQLRTKLQPDGRQQSTRP